MMPFQILVVPQELAFVQVPIILLTPPPPLPLPPLSLTDGPTFEELPKNPEVFFNGFEDSETFLVPPLPNYKKIENKIKSHNKIEKKKRVKKLSLPIERLDLKAPKIEELQIKFRKDPKNLPIKKRFGKCKKL